jgi:transposase-like protein
MAGKRKVHTSAFKARVAMDAVQGDRTVNKLAGQFDVHTTLIHTWKMRRLAAAEGPTLSPRFRPVDLTEGPGALPRWRPGAISRPA